MKVLVSHLFLFHGLISLLGMPDDCTVIAMHVVGRSPHDKMDKDHQ